MAAVVPRRKHSVEHCVILMSNTKIEVHNLYRHMDYQEFGFEKSILPESLSKNLAAVRRIPPHHRALDREQLTKNDFQLLQYCLKLNF